MAASAYLRRSVTGGTFLAGNTTGASVAVGGVGEYLSYIRPLGSFISVGASATAHDVCMLSLTAGDWDVWGEAWIQEMTTTGLTAAAAFINNSSNAMPASISDGVARVNLPWAGVPSFFVLGLGPCRVITAATINYYLGVWVAYGGGGIPQGGGKLSARRRQ